MSELLNLNDAVAIAGVGGVIRRAGIDYTVKQVDSQYYLDDEPLSTFTATDSWEIIKQETELRTAAMFFADISPGDVVTRGYRSYVYTGQFPYHLGGFRIALVSMENHEVLWLTKDHLALQNDWSKTDHTPGWEIYLKVAALDHQIESLNQSVEGNLAVIASLRSDFDKLNEFLNEYADNQNMCSDYERTLDEWNDEFSIMKLVGRERDWKVAITINGGRRVFLGPVTARSAEEAAEIVEGMSTMEVIQSLYYNGDLDIEVDEDNTEVCDY